MDVTAPSTVACLAIFHAAGLSSATMPLPEPTSRSPVLSSTRLVTPSPNLPLSGPLLLKTLCGTETSNTSPVEVPAYACWSSAAITRLLIWRRTVPITTSDTSSFCVTGLMSHTRRICSPAVISWKSDVLAKASVSVKPLVGFCAGDEPHTAAA